MHLDAGIAVVLAGSDYVHHRYGGGGTFQVVSPNG